MQLTCTFCQRTFQHGPHRYEGRGVPGWDAHICDPCDATLDDGLVPAQHPALMRRLAEAGVPLAQTGKGWIVIPR